MSAAEVDSLFTQRSSSSNGLELNAALSRVQDSMGTFQNRVRWCEDLATALWKWDIVEIDASGMLKKYIAEKSRGVAGDQFTAEQFVLIDHLQSCQVQLVEHGDYMFPVIKIQVLSGLIYLLVDDLAAFETLFCSLLWWSALKPAGIFNKLTVGPSDWSKETKDPINLLVSQLLVFGPLPKSKNIPLIKNLSRPSFLSDTDVEEAWFPAMGVLKSNGILDLLLQSDGSLLYSLDITVLIKSEIRIVDASLQANNYMFIGVLPALRNELNISANCRFILGNRTKKNTGIIFKFPLMIDVEDWFNALESFALSEHLALAGSHESNKLRVSNRFRVSVIEGDFTGCDAIPYDPKMYLDFRLWGHIWARTPIVSDGYKPFWREEFSFEEAVKIDKLRIEVKQKKTKRSKKNETIGFIELSQESINDGSLSKETRLPVFDINGGGVKIGTLCIKVTSSLNFILPKLSFTTFEDTLSHGCIKGLTSYLYDTPLGLEFKFDDLSAVLLDIFHALGKEEEWFTALIDKELADVDSSITRNTLKNKTSIHIFSTLFRGNSPLTKSVEKYFYRVGKEYLDKSIGDILREIIHHGKSCEVDPSRIQEQDLQKKETILIANRTRLLQFVERIWANIYYTSNDLPISMKNLMKIFRNKLELLCIDEDFSTTLNCISAILFLRFFCPVILNPKLFGFVGSHLSDIPRRTLTLISKVLLNLSNGSNFGKKEPYMIELNSFIELHKEEVLDYVDKVTQKKLDFSPKLLKLNSSVARPKVVLKEGASEEFSNPYLIDRYLRETELFLGLAALTINKQADSGMSKSLSVEEMTKNVATLNISPRKKSTDIGDLEFEKITNNTETFGNDFKKYLEKNEFQPDGKLDEVFTNGLDKMEELRQESLVLFRRSEHLKQVFSDCEVPTEETIDQMDFAQFLPQNAYYTKERKIFVDKDITIRDTVKYFKLFDSATGRSRLLESLLPKSDSVSVDKASFVSSWNGVSMKARGFVRLNSTKLHRKLTGSSEESVKIETTQTMKKWFRKGK